MSRKGFNGVGGPSAVAALCAALALCASCASENRSPPATKSAPPAPAPAANMNTSGSAGGQNAAGAEPLQGSRFGTRLSNQTVGAGINNNADADTRGSNKAAGGAKKSRPAGRKKR